jgi:hypothetical protein
MEDIIQQLKNFWLGEPVVGDYIIKEKVNCVMDTTRPKCVIFVGIGQSFFNGGDLKGSLDARSKLQTKSMRNGHKFVADVMMVRPGSPTWQERFTRGFYHYNPHRATSDSILAFKICRYP